MSDHHGGVRGCLWRSKGTLARLQRAVWEGFGKSRQLSCADCAGHACGWLVGDLGLEFSTVLPPLGRITLLASVQETVSPGARKAPGWPGL